MLCDSQSPDCTLGRLIGMVPMSRPAGDPVDRDHFAGSPLQATDGLIRTGLSYPVRTLTVFTCLACQGTSAFPIGVDCHPRTTVCHLLIFNHKQYDKQPTRGFHSTMFIHGSLDTEAISISSALRGENFTCPQTLAGPLPPVQSTFLQGAHPPFGTLVQWIVQQHQYLEVTGLYVTPYRGPNY